MKLSNSNKAGKIEIVYFNVFYPGFLINSTTYILRGVKNEQVLLSHKLFPEVLQSEKYYLHKQLLLLKYLNAVLLQVKQ